MNAAGIIAAITPVVVAFEQLGIDYHIGGSVVSSIYGFPRATFDVDLIADLQPKHVSFLVKQLNATYYIDEDMIRDALRHQSSFNILYLDTMLKIDVFIPKHRAFDKEEQHHIQQAVLVEGTRSFFVTSPEDIILNKLEWYRMGNEISDRQWNDILGVLKMQGTKLDLAYLQQWSQVLKVSDLLQRALIDAGLAQ
ncbi:MAG: hypothetical protein NVS4B11_21550 [Ktedonobacteraceae bacterium]